MRVSSDMPDDVLVLHDALQRIRETFGTPAQYASSPSPSMGEPEGAGGLSIFLKNCGTALRFLQVHIAKCYPGAPITLTGDPRLMERDGAPTTQTTSALILHGEPIPVAENESPYITMSRRMAENYQLSKTKLIAPLRQRIINYQLEACWSSASYWYEYIAIHGGELLLEGLQPDSLQGDRIVADLYAKYFGVETEFVEDGALIRSVSPKDRLSTFDFEQRGLSTLSNAVSIDFTNCPDLYPAIALTCERLGITLQATGTDRLRHKESDRIEAVRLHEVRNDHRMAMALLAADFPVAESEQNCIAKSYPQFPEIYRRITTVERRSTDGQPTVKANVSTPSVTHITPIRGVNDDNLGKKHALSKLIHAATTEYVWLHDDDVVLPSAAMNNCQLSIVNCQFGNADLIILPLRMESSPSLGRANRQETFNFQFSIFNLLQIAEYAAIQELTMRTAKRGHAVMCSGANLIVRREAWLACEPDLHPEIPSGDDMFLLEAMKKRGYKISVIDEPDFTAVVRPQTTWRAFFRQRMRWAGKAPKYTDPDILRCGALIVAANLLQLLCPLILLIKFPIEYSLIRRRQMREQTTINYQLSIINFSIALLLEILYPFYILLSLLGGLFRQKKW